MRFIDHVIVQVRSGKGGAGCVAFRREKFVPHGGPSGGNGGRGGSVVLEADGHLNTLLDFRYQPHQFAPAGHPGAGNNRTGKNGKDLVLRVPCGTLARLTETQSVLGEVIQPGDQLLLAQGGRGGRGNTYFKGASRQAPRYAQPGEPGEEKSITLELKMLADVGLVGLPNVGKSTLVSTISAARPKIADYPFTTLVPMRGVVSVSDFESFVIADIPGIIEGAAQGKGLGLRFLRHIERNAVLLILIPVTSEDPVREYHMLMHELSTHDASLLHKPLIVAFSKTDLLPPNEHAPWLADTRIAFDPDTELMLISSVTGQGLVQLKRAIWARVKEERRHATIP